MYPPLKNSDWLSKEKEVLIRQVLEGKKGIIVVNGTQFNQVMPKQDFLTNAQIASVLTYVRKEMGNQTDSVTVLEVSKIRDSLH
jgi:mono/diheme cytochrome c family protein